MLRLRSFAGLVIFVLFLVCVGLAQAAPEKAGAEKTPSAMDLRWDTAIWSVAVFVMLMVILRLKAWGPILEGLKKREDAIRTSLEDAKKTRDEMVVLQAKFQKDLAESHQEIPKLMEEARRDAEQLSNEMRAKAMADIQAERDRLRREVELAKDQALKELWEQTAMLASLISTKAVGRLLTPDDHRQLLDEAMKEISSSTRN